MAKSMKPGGGGKFAAVEAAAAKSGARNPAAVAAAAGRKKYGGEQMAKMAERGKERATAERKGEKKPPLPKVHELKAPEKGPGLEEALKSAAAKAKK